MFDSELGYFRHAFLLTSHVFQSLFLLQLALFIRRQGPQLLLPLAVFFALLLEQLFLFFVGLLQGLELLGFLAVLVGLSPGLAGETEGGDTVYELEEQLDESGGVLETVFGVADVKDCS